MEYDTEDITFIIKDSSEREHEDDERDSEINGFVFLFTFPGRQDSEVWSQVQYTRIKH